MTSATDPSTAFNGVGSCLCGAITYTLNAPPFQAILCHCRNCRKSSGTAFMTNCFYPTTSLHITHHLSPTTLKGYADHDTVTGATVERQFCGTCGSSLFALNDQHEEMVVVANGSVDEGVENEILRPKLEFFCKDQRAWMVGREEGGVDKREVL